MHSTRMVRKSVGIHTVYICHTHNAPFFSMVDVSTAGAGSVGVKKAGVGNHGIRELSEELSFGIWHPLRLSSDRAWKKTNAPQRGVICTVAYGIVYISKRHCVILIL